MNKFACDSGCMHLFNLLLQDLITEPNNYRGSIFKLNFMRFFNQHS